MHSSTRIRRIVALVGAAALAATLAACAPGGDAASGDCTLTMIASADRPDAEQAAWREVFDAYEAEYGCKVETKFQGAWNEITQQLSAARLSGEQVNLFLAGTASRDLAKAGLAMDLNECIAPFEDRFLPEAMAAYNVGDHQWAVPMSSTDTSAIFYNKTMFDELGIAAPTTYAELVAAGDQVAAAKGIVPMIHQGKSPWYWPMWYFGAFAQASGNKSIEYTEDFLAGKRQFDSPEEIEALASLANFTKDGLLDQTTMDTDEQGMFASFVQGKAAMFYGLTPMLISVRDANPDFEIGVFQFPRVVSDDSVALQVGGGPENGISIASFAPENTKVASCQLLEFMSRPDNAATILNAGHPFVPSIVSVPANLDEPLAPQLVEEFIPNTITFLDWIWPAAVNDAVTSGVIDIMYNGKSADEAAKGVQAALDKLVAEEDYQYEWWTAWTDEDWQKVSFPADMSIEVKN